MSRETSYATKHFDRKARGLKEGKRQKEKGNVRGLRIFAGSAEKGITLRGRRACRLCKRGP